MKKYFITGLLIWVPLVATIWVLNFLIGTLDQSLLLLPVAYRPDTLLGMHIPGLGAIVTLLIILITGVLAANYFGRQLLALWESVLARIPVVKSIYTSIKQVSDTLFSGSGEAFRKVLLVRYPHPEAWSIAFQTNVPSSVAEKLGPDYVAVFIPTTPSPVNGFYFFVKKSEAIELNIHVDQALKFIVSMGVATQDKHPRGQ
ncbi:MAG: DUF502 domain-containing protein [Burkholderiales bacterium]